MDGWISRETLLQHGITRRWSIIVLNAHISKTLETVASFLDHPVTV